MFSPEPYTLNQQFSVSKLLGTLGETPFLPILAYQFCLSQASGTRCDLRYANNIVFANVYKTLVQQVCETFKWESQKVENSTYSFVLCNDFFSQKTHTGHDKNFPQEMGSATFM